MRKTGRGVPRKPSRCNNCLLVSDLALVWFYTCLDFVRRYVRSDFHLGTYRSEVLELFQCLRFGQSARVFESSCVIMLHSYLWIEIKACPSLFRACLLPLDQFRPIRAQCTSPSMRPLPSMSSSHLEGKRTWPFPPKQLLPPPERRPMPPPSVHLKLAEKWLRGEIFCGTCALGRRNRGREFQGGRF